MKRIVFSLLGISMAGLLGCATPSDIRVQTTVESEADFSGIATYAWHPELNKPTGHPRVDDEQLNAWVRAAVDGDLQAKGLTMNADSPDVYVGYAAALERKLDTATINQQYGYAPGWGSNVSASPGYRRYSPGWEPGGKSTYRYDEGTLVLDIIDASSQKLLRRAAAQARANEKKRSDAERQQRLEGAIQRMLDGFPR